jgi:hypothetical protein
MKTSVKAVIIALAIGILAFAANPLGPLGGFWRPAPHGPDPAGIQLALFIALFAAEALAFGVGIAFLLYGYPLVLAVAPRSTGLSRAAHLAIAWLFLNWWPHDSLHVHWGESSVARLLFLEYGFHFSVIVAGLILTAFLLSALRQERALAA